MQFTTKKFPSLVVRLGLGHRAKFAEGEFETENHEVASRLADFAERHPEYEIESDGEMPEAPEPVEDDPENPDEEPEGEDDADDEDADGESDEDNPFGL